MQSVGDEISAAAFRKRRRTSPSPQQHLEDPPLKHPASAMHDRGKRTARLTTTSHSSWMRTAMVHVQPSPATMAKVEKAHEFLQRRWTARQQQQELHLQKEGTAYKVRKSTYQAPTSSLQCRFYTHAVPHLASTAVTCVSKVEKQKRIVRKIKNAVWIKIAVHIDLNM